MLYKTEFSLLCKTFLSPFQPQHSPSAKKRKEKAKAANQWLWSSREDPHSFEAHWKNRRGTTALSSVLPWMIPQLWAWVQPKEVGTLSEKDEGATRDLSATPPSCWQVSSKEWQVQAVWDMGIPVPGAGLIYSHTMTTGSWSSLVWSTGDGTLLTISRKFI